MPSKMKKAQKPIASDASLDRKEKHVSSEIKGKLGSGMINGKGHSKLKTPCLTKTTQESGKKKENLDKKDKHVSSENKGGLGNSRSGGDGGCNAKTLPKINKKCKSGKSTGSLDRKEEHVSLKNEGEPHLKALSKKKKRPKSKKKNQSPDGKEEHGSLQNDDRICNNKSYNEGDPNLKLPSKTKKAHNLKLPSMTKKAHNLKLPSKTKKAHKFVVPHLSQKLAQKMSFSHTYKVTDIPFHNQCEKTPTIFSWVGGAATTQETIPFHNQHVMTPPTISPWVGAATTRTTYKPTTNKKKQESGKKTENLDKKDKHVSSENNCRLVNSWSGGEGDCNLKTISNRKKRRESGKSNGSLDRKEEHVSSKNEGRLSDSMDQDHAWGDPKKSVGGGTPGRRIGKLFVSNTEIAKGSSGTIVLEGFYEGRSVAVKRLVRAQHHIASQEIQSLRASDGDPNIVRLYGAERDQDFVYLALERCACSLDDLIRARSNSSGKSVFPHDPASNANVEYKMHLGSVEGTMQDVNLWREDGHPSPLLLKLMREVVSGLVHLHRLGIIHRGLKPQNILITKELCAKLSDMAISRLLPGDTSSSEYHVSDCGKSGVKASEQLCPAQQPSSVDAFGLGCILFFCVTGGRHPFGDSLKGDSNTGENTMYLSPVEFMPEAADLFARLLNRDPNLRPKALEVLHHPLFWNSKTRLSFLRDVSDWVKSKGWGTNSDAPGKLESIAERVFDEEWKEKIDCEFMKHMRKFRAYVFKRVEDLLRIVRNTFSHYRELPPEIQEIVGSSPEDLDCYFTRRFPRLLIETYRFVSMSCKDEEPSPFPEYFNG
ncbi:serine/threonine-protein kinase/endoribonuclease IRE1a-like [Rhodamnia argentea]|uniref:Serine/threonine-protein kinase/endoribonuclease IRE1a-like n=1 Tax=Rhodamnia argentea TaxID=178133 RepID=A0ABM3HSQ9_9MYRT|nr:serine/threonine-protein kinase/endoribonuclease IRE1a-like [Rhodamnia argentea]